VDKELISLSLLQL